jgi:hypothetical protein
MLCISFEPAIVEIAELLALIQDHGVLIVLSRLLLRGLLTLSDILFELDLDFLSIFAFLLSFV